MRDTQSEFESLYRNTGKCCITGKPMVESAHLNFIATKYRATWQYPVISNLAIKVQSIAVAIVHDECMKPGTGPDESLIKWVVEWSDTEGLKYHEVETMEIHPAWLAAHQPKGKIISINKMIKP